MSTQPMPRIVRNQVAVNTTRALRSVDDLIRALRELPMPVQNEVLHDLVDRLENGYADPKRT